MTTMLIQHHGILVIFYITLSIVLHPSSLWLLLGFMLNADEGSLANYCNESIASEQ